jgi:L-serine dehydratase
MGGLIGGEAEKMNRHQVNGNSICGSVLSRGITYAMGVLEVNASMGLIVAAPTAGSSGIVPGLLLSLQEEYAIPRDKMIEALFNAGAVGYLAMRNATVAGAVGGCQAEVGVASAMAASAAVEIMGGSPAQCLGAASTVLMNMLGLVCDPVAGLVEYPCQSRNAAGVANALIAAEIALSGVPQLIPLDEMIASMYSVGKRLPAELRETALGGCAATPTGCEMCRAGL